MRVLIDTNIILDFQLEREPFLQGKLAEKLSKPPKLSTRPTADKLVKNVLSGHRCVGRRPILAGILTLLW